VLIVPVDGGVPASAAWSTGGIAATSQQYPLKMALGVDAWGRVNLAKDRAKGCSGYTDTGVTSSLGQADVRSRIEGHQVRLLIVG